MTKPPRLLLPVARTLAILAIVAGVGAGLVEMALSQFICYDVCPDPTSYSSQLGDSAFQALQPCVALALAGLLILAIYCALTGRGRRGAMAALLVALAGVVGVVALYLLLTYARSTAPAGASGSSAAPMLESSMFWWGVAVALVGGGWSAILTWLSFTTR